MTPEAQRIAIAEACGTHKVEVLPFDGGTMTLITDANGRIRCIRQMEDGPQTESCPKDWIAPLDYRNDLNAMHEAEKVLHIDKLDVYADWLHENNSSGGHPAQLCHWHASAAQRAEAFLRTLNLWKDDN